MRRVCTLAPGFGIGVNSVVRQMNDLRTSGASPGCGLCSLLEVVPEVCDRFGEYVDRLGKVRG